MWKGIVAGALAGAAGGAAMQVFHASLSGRGRTGAYEPQSKKPVAPGEDATMRAAELAARTVGAERLEHAERQAAGPWMHYAFSVVCGASYGALREITPQAGLARGGRFGVAVWVGADQLALPLMRLSPWPLSAYSVGTNAQLLLAHVVFGIVTDLTWRTARRALD